MEERLSRNIFLATISKTLVFFLSALTNIFINWYLGPEGIGVIAYAISFTTIVAIVANVGMDTTIKKMVPEEKKPGEIVVVYFFLQGILLIMGLLLGIIIFSQGVNQGIYLNSDSEEYYLFLAVKIVGLTSYLLETIFISLNRVILPTIIVIIGNLFFLIAVLLIIFFNGGIIGIGWCYLGQNIITLLLFSILSGKIPFSKLQKQKIFNFIKITLPLAIIVLGVAVNESIHVLLIKQFYSPLELGYFSLYLKIVPLITIIPLTIMGLILPPIVQYNQQHEYRKIKETTETVERYTSIIQTMVFIALIGFTSEILYVFGGTGFQTTEMTNIYLVGCSITYFTSQTIIFTQITLGLEGGLRFFIKSSGVLLMVQLILNLILIPLDPFKIGGGMEAIIAIFLASLINMIALRIFCKKSVNYKYHLSNLWHPLAGIVPIICIKFGMSFFMINFQENYLIGAFFIGLFYLLGVGIFFLILYLVREFTLQDFKNIKDLLKIQKTFKFLKSELQKILRINLLTGT